MKHRSKPIVSIRILIIIGVLGLSIIFTVYSEAITEYALDALKLCVGSVIPSLFPFMVLSGIASTAAASLSGDSSRRSSIAVSVMLGALCGFPIGASSVASIYKNGVLQKKEAEFLCAICNNAGPAFVIGVIGCNFWNSQQTGSMFYICQLLSSAIVFTLFRPMFGNRKNNSKVSNGGCIKAKPHIMRLSNLQSATKKLPQLFCDSVAGSAVGIIRICGYVVFFRVLCSTLRLFIRSSNFSDVLYAVISAILEFTSGAKCAAEIGGISGIVLCGFTVGFSGLSVITQTVDILSTTDLSPTPLILLKVLIGTLCAILSAICYSLFPVSETVSAWQITYSTLSMAYISAGIILLFAAAKTICKLKDLR